MTFTQSELYHYTKGIFINDLQRISPDCVSPLIAIRKVVKRAIEKYCANFCTKGNAPFSEEDFQRVSKKLYEEIKSGTL